MSTQDRQNTLLWMRDLIEHMSSCHEQLQWASEDHSAYFLTGRMMENLAECRRLCEDLRAGRGASCAGAGMA